MHTTMRATECTARTEAEVRPPSSCNANSMALTCERAQERKRENRRDSRPALVSAQRMLGSELSSGKLLQACRHSSTGARAGAPRPEQYHYHSSSIIRLRTRARRGSKAWFHARAHLCARMRALGTSLVHVALHTPRVHAAAGPARTKCRAQNNEV